MIVPYGIPSQKNQAKEGLTLRLKLEHFPTLHKHVYLLDLQIKKMSKQNKNKLDLPRHHEPQDFP